MAVGFQNILQRLRDFVWGPPLLVLLLGTGIYLMILLRGLPLRNLGMALKIALGIDGAGDQKKGEKGAEKEISAFSSLATELAATIGIGNIIGVVSAMTLGGPGALLWMILCAMIGLATKLVESTLSVKYRMKRTGEPPLGGPMITLATGFPFPRVGKFLAALYALLAVLGSFGMGNMVQGSSVAASMEASFGIGKAQTGIFLTILTILAILGGMKMISKISTYLVPAMGAIYLAGCLGIILFHPQNLLPGIRDVFLAALSPRAVSGGLFGTVTCTMAESLKWGVARGIFSNEAGLGAGGISAAASKEKDPVRQGYVSMTGVFFDTIVICTVTGIAYACSGVAGMAQRGELFLRNGMMVNLRDGSAMMVAAFETVFGRFGGALLGTCISLFAFATILGWAAQGEAAFGYLFGFQRVMTYRFLYGLMTFVGAVFAVETVWTISDICNGLLAIPNLICVLVMAPEICADIRRAG